jgi:hypothetical protein
MVVAYTIIDVCTPKGHGRTRTLQGHIQKPLENNIADHRPYTDHNIQGI